MTLYNYYYHLLILIISLLLITPSYILIYHKFLHFIIDQDSPRPLKISLSIFCTNTILSFIITYLLFFKILNQYISFLILIPGIIYCLKNIKTLKASITFNSFKVIYLIFITIFLFCEVSAASILAKCAREEEMEVMRKKLGIECGSGYPADPVTKEFLKNNWEKYPEIFRKSWSSYLEYSGGKRSKKQLTLGEF